MKKFTKNTTLATVLKNKGLERILKRHNIPCLGCPFSQMEMAKLKIGDICQMYNIDSEKLLLDLNRATKK